jgi:hypothetical protein
LKGEILDAVAGALLPPADPATAKVAVAVEDHDRL